MAGQATITLDTKDAVEFFDKALSICGDEFFEWLQNYAGPPGEFPRSISLPPLGVLIEQFLRRSKK